MALVKLVTFSIVLSLPLNILSFIINQIDQSSTNQNKTWNFRITVPRSIWRNCVILPSTDPTNSSSLMSNQLGLYSKAKQNMSKQKKMGRWFFCTWTKRTNNMLVVTKNSSPSKFNSCWQLIEKKSSIKQLCFSWHFRFP